MSSDHISVAHLDPVWLHFIEAMERRAAGHSGETRRLLDVRIAALRADPARCLQTGPTASCANTSLQTGPLPSSLAELVAQMADRASSRIGAPAQDARAASAANVAPTEIESLAYFRITWSRLSAERRLKRSLATVPNNAGPLNSHQLVHRALQMMRETSPGYLHHFMTYADALLWVDRSGADAGSNGHLATLRTKAAKNVVRRK